MRIFAFVKCICLDHTNKKEHNPKSFKSRMFFNSYRNLVTNPKYYDGDDSLEDDYSDENAYII